MRPANIVTAVADILAGIAVSGYFFLESYDPVAVLWLVLATIGLYGGGVVMNDVFDAELDAVERPERPIPSGIVRRGAAATFGVGLLAAGVILAAQVSFLSAMLALAIALGAVLYDRWAKHHGFWGPLTMGLCRGMNLLLGISIIASQVTVYWFLGIVPVVYIAAITMISQGEVHGGKKSTLYWAAALYGLAIAGILYVAAAQDEFLVTLAFTAFWAIMIFLPLRRAMGQPEGRMIGKAVKAGVLALILMNAAWASAFGAIATALVIVSLLPLSLLLARAFAVT